MSKKTTKFQEESAAMPDSPAAQPSNALAIFGATTMMEKYEAKAERRNMPTMVKPGDVPMGGVLAGEIIRIVDSPVSTIKGKLIWLKHEKGTEFTFPCTGVIRNALAPGVQGDKDLTAALDKEVGKILICKRLPDKPSKYKKNMFMFDVFTAKA